MNLTPGLVRRKKPNVTYLYWSAEAITKKADGYPNKWLKIPHTYSEAQIEAFCQHEADRLRLWMAGESETPELNGTIASVCNVFERHDDSPMRTVKHNTANFYMDALKIVKANIGDVAVSECKGIDARRWFKKWREPRAPGMPERLKRAHSAISTLIAALRFGQAIGGRHGRECTRLATEMSGLRFPKPEPRRAEMTYAHAKAFVEVATANGHHGLAIGIAAQFELGVRQKDVIGEHHAGRWIGTFTWENIAGAGIWRLRTFKTKAPAAFDLKTYDLLWPLLQAVPQTERAGPIVKNQSGDPIRESDYRKKYRRLARQAGIPDDVWNMDARAGAATEALESGVSIEDVSRSLTHASTHMTRSYERRNQASIKLVGEARKRSRT